MQRVALGQPARARSLLEDPAGDPITDGNVTVTVVSDRDGTTHLDDAVAAHVEGTGWVADLPPEAVAQLDLLTTTWRAETAGGASYQWQTTIEVAGAHLFTLGRAREHNRLGRQPVHVIEDVRLDAERALEDRCGFAFVPRYTRATVRADARERSEPLPSGARLPIVLPVVRVRRLIAATTADVPAAPELLARVSVSRAGVVRGLEHLPAGEVELALEHGDDDPPGGALDAALLLAADMADTSANPRLIRRGDDAGGFEVFYSNDAQRGAFDIPAVEAFCRRVERRRLT